MARKQSKSINQQLTEIQDFLSARNISGILYVPGIGTMSIYRKSIEKLAVLNYAQIELYAKKMNDRMEAYNMMQTDIIDNKAPVKKTNSPGYTG